VNGVVVSSEVFRFKMPVKCAVPTCFSLNRILNSAKTRVSYFSTPKDSLMLTRWENNIDLFDGQHLTSKSKLCQLHFAESDIIKGKTVKKNGTDIFIPHAHWRLKTSAVPICVRSQTLQESAVDEGPLSEQSSGGKVNFIFYLIALTDVCSTNLSGMTNKSIRAVEEPTCAFPSLCDSSPTSDVNEQQSSQSSQGKVYLFNYFDIIDKLSTIFTGMSNNSHSAAEESTCRFVQLGRTNIGISSIQQQVGKKRPLDTENLPAESNAAKLIRLDGATLNVSSRTSSQVVGFQNIFH
jgi:hypothetical protein